MDFDYSAYADYTPIGIVVSIIFTIWAIVVLWIVFQKAERPGWAAIVPIYNIITLLRVAGLSGWLVLLMLVPVANLIVAAFIGLGVARNFGKSRAFGFFLLWIFSLIGYSILAFGNAKYDFIDPRIEEFRREYGEVEE